MGSGGSDGGSNASTGVTSTGVTSTGVTSDATTDGYDPVAVMRSFRACCEQARREASSATFALAMKALKRAEERMNQFSLEGLQSLVAQSEERQAAIPKLRDACSRASRKLRKLNKVSAMKRAFGYNTNVKDAIAHLARQADLTATVLGGGGANPNLRPRPRLPAHLYE